MSDAEKPTIVISQSPVSGANGRQTNAVMGIDRSIALQTRQGTDIVNTQCRSPFSTWDDYQASSETERHPHAILRGEKTGIYNCHGLVFASRRTGIYESKELHKILQEDDYEKIDRNDLLPGDVLVYLDKETGDIEHSAIVVSEPDRAMLGIPRVLSKWGRSYETVHYANDCPYNYANVVYYRIKR